MKIIENIINNVWFQRAFWSIIIILIGLIVYRMISNFLKTNESKNPKLLMSKKNKTFIRMLKSIIGTAIGIIAVLTILQIFGINVTSMLAGVGIASIVIGFALQDALKDIIRGFEIVSDGYYEIGDVVKYGNNTGQVLSINLRTTKIQDINSMNIVSIANRNIDQVEIVSEYIYIPIPFPLSAKPDNIKDAIDDIVKAINKSPNVTSAAYQGVTDITNSSINHQIVLTCDPMNKLQVRRDALGTIVDSLREHKIAVPHSQLDVHQK